MWGFLAVSFAWAERGDTSFVPDSVRSTVEDPQVELMRAPDGFCDAEPLQPPPPPRRRAAVPVAVALEPDGSITLDAVNVPAGVLLEQIGRTARVLIEARGWGAYVPIYAHVEEMSLDTLVRRIAAASGLQIVQGSGLLRLVDARDAIRVDRGKEVDLALEPLELRVYTVQAASQIGQVVAQTVLGCRGRLVASGHRGELLVIDTPSNMLEIDHLVHALTESEGGVFSRSWSTGSRARLGVPDPPAQLCPIEPEPLGASVGGWLVSIGQRDEVDVVVGCGARRALGPISQAPELRRAAATTWFSEIMRDVYVGPAMAAAVERYALLERPIWQVQTYVVDTPAIMAERLVEEFGKDVTAVAYEPLGTVVVGGKPEVVQSVEAALVRWADAPLSTL